MASKRRNLTSFPVERTTGGSQDTGFRADRRPTQVKMVMIEHNALLMLTSIGKAFLTLKKQGGMPDTVETYAIQAAVNVAEHALNVSDNAR